MGVIRASDSLRTLLWFPFPVIGRADPSICSDDQETSFIFKEKNREEL
jgi:hypothetical protein